MRDETDPTVLVTWDSAVARELQALARAGEQKAQAEAQADGFGYLPSKTRLLHDGAARGLVWHIAELERRAPDGLDVTGDGGDYGGPRTPINNLQTHLASVCVGLNDYHQWLDRHEVPRLVRDTGEVGA